MLFLRPASAAQVNQFSAISALFMLVKSDHRGKALVDSHMLAV